MTLVESVVLEMARSEAEVEQLIGDNIRAMVGKLAANFATKYCLPVGGDVEHVKEELFSVGMAEAVRCAQTYDPDAHETVDLGTGEMVKPKFSTYAYRCVWGVMQNWCDKYFEGNKRFTSIDGQVRQDGGEDDESSVSTLANTLTYDDVEGGTQDSNDHDPEWRANQRDIYDLVHGKIFPALEAKDKELESKGHKPIYLACVKMLFGFDGPAMSQAEIAKKLGITPQTVYAKFNNFIMPLIREIIPNSYRNMLFR